MKKRDRNRALRPRKGVTLIEVLVAVSLLAVLSMGMLMAMRIGLNALAKANDKLMQNRRVVAAQRILESQIAGIVPVRARCVIGPEQQMEMMFFQGEPQAMRFVSTYSLAGAWRGIAEILEFQVIPGENSQGVRLVVNEIPYTGPVSAGTLCMGRRPDPVAGGLVALFRPIQIGPQSFVLADKLAACRFLYQAPKPPGTPAEAPNVWKGLWTLEDWPLAVRVEMAPLDDSPGRLRPLTVTVPVRINKSREISYVDQ